ncbi:metalloproteinase inhibitor 3-like [Pecten maximus]|uniref:metalloproteinase inhibitor 3-like n=1 Tax=Pecten maximus TaxID=6579 RepID=UPI0014586D02|nr:metalloproteinase inhibitor 3-like [Pecten maximus]
MTFFNFTLVCLMLATICIQHTFACSCFLAPNFPDRYCSSGFIFRGEVKNETLDRKGNFGFEDKYVYTVKVDKVYKSTELAKEKVNSNDMVQLETPKYGSLCGRPLRVGGDYLISVTPYMVARHSVVMAINTCEWIEEYSRISPADKRNLEDEFECGFD